MHKDKTCIQAQSTLNVLPCYEAGSPAYKVLCFIRIFKNIDIIKT